MEKYGFLHNIKKIFEDSFSIFKHLIERDCIKLYSLLFRERHNDLDKLCCGDADNFAWYIPHHELKIFCFYTQQNNFVVFIKEKKKERSIYVYEYFDDFNYNDHNYEGVMKTTVPIKYFLQHQKSSSISYSDCIDGNKYISHPNLEFILQNNHFLHDKEFQQSIFYKPLLHIENNRLYKEQDPFLLKKFWKIEEFLMTLEFLIECKIREKEK